MKIVQSVNRIWIYHT